MTKPPNSIAAFRARGDEIVAHGRTNSERQGAMSEAEEAAVIAEVTARIAAEEGKPPSGWLGPWISQSAVTPDLLAEAGYAYGLDWAMDEQPVYLRTRGGGRLLAVPYPQELNDIPMIVVPQRGRARLRRGDHRRLRRNARTRSTGAACNGRGAARLHRRLSASASPFEAGAASHCRAQRQRMVDERGRHRQTLFNSTARHSGLNLLTAK